MDRRDFIRLASAGAAATGLGLPLGCSRGGSSDRKVVVLGLDGLDPGMIGAMMAAGTAPNFKKLSELGAFSRLQTTMPALSPVAWSSFITGLTPGGHGIADFIMRDPETHLPIFSIYEAGAPSMVLPIGEYRLPLRGGEVKNLRRGKPFWAYLTEQGIPAVVVKIPTNFPVDETVSRGVSGMGTPDLTDAYGMFGYYTTDEFEHYPDISGGHVHYIQISDNKVRTDLIGPENSLRVPRDTRRDPFANRARLPFTVYRDPAEPTIRIDIGGQSVVLREGEYSDWVHVDFELMPMLGSVGGIVRFLAKEVRPHLKLYVTPINIDPEAQAMAVTYPESYGGELAREIGPFWTKGLPADTKAFDYKVLRDEDYVKQAELILRERMALFDYEWSRFKSGLFYFYVSSTDQDAHMLWRNMDKNHPMHGESDVRFSGYLHHLYQEMDALVGKVLPAIDDDTLLLICSDHGFASFGRQFHLNTWLRDQGYLAVKDASSKKETTDITDIDWSKTAAYGIGFNGLYLNRRGREGHGILDDSEAARLTERLSRELIGLSDSETSVRPVSRVYRREEVYSGELTPEMPELLVGYTPGYRCSAPSVLGETGRQVIDLNPWAWSGDHSMDRALVPGSLFASRRLTHADPSIVDLPVTILDFFGIAKPGPMVGRSLL